MLKLDWNKAKNAIDWKQAQKAINWNQAKAAIDWLMVELKLKGSVGVIGVDIGTSNIKLLELSESSGSYQVENFACVPLPTGAVVEKDIKDTAAVATTIRNLLVNSSFRTKNIAIAVPDSSVIAKVIQLDATLREADIENQILLEADSQIPYPVDEVSLDFQVMGINAKNPQWLDVLLVASHKDNVDARIAVAAASQLQPKVVDVESFAVERAYSMLLKQLPLEGAKQTVAIVDIGGSILSLTVLYDKEVIFTRNEIFGGQQQTLSIEQHFGLSAADAELAKCQGGKNLPPEYEAEVLEPFREAIVLQIRRALQFFFSTNQHNEVQTILLAGGTALFPGIAEFVTERLGIRTQVVNPFAEMSIASWVDTEKLNKMAPMFLLACGLALRGK